MRKMIAFLLSLLLMLSASAVFAQSPESPEGEETGPTLEQRFPAMKVGDRMNIYAPVKYYRFFPDVLFYDLIDLSYFPQEAWNKDKWMLLGRWDDGKTFNQILYTDTPTPNMVVHGIDIGQDRGFLKDFYLYTTLFIRDNYPADTGSCYVYYSNSLMIGYKESKGIFIDPESGIYQSTNSYGGSRHATYTPNTIKHSLELLQELNPEDYAFDPEDIAGSSFGAADFTRQNFDAQFIQDLESVDASFRMAASPEIKVYRIEVIRVDGISDIYINGHKVYSEKDMLTKSEAGGRAVPDKVSWSYGPLLNEGGMTVTCTTGDLYIFGTGLKEE